MEIEYTVALGCEPKRRFGEAGLWRRLRLIGSRPLSATVAPDVPRELVEAAFDLRPVVFHCSGCPADIDGRGFGCYGTVGLPLSAEAESWLMALLPPTLRPPRREPAPRGHPALALQVSALRQVLDRIDALAIDGSRVEKALRETHLLELPRPAVRRYGSMLARTFVTSSRLLELLLLQEAVGPEVSEVVCRALGAWVEGNRSEDGVPEVHFTLPPDEEDDPSIADLKRLLHALMVAASLDVPVRTRLRGED